MRAIAIQKFGGPEVLELMDLPKPKPQAGEILMDIKAAGVNPVDWKIREGLFQGRMPHKFPIILGWDAAGVITELGKEVSGFQIGQEVFAYTRGDVIHPGSYAEFICLTPEHLSPKPANLSFEEAAAVPLSALTAYQVLFENIQLRSGETILIHAGAGGVGGYAIQLAKNAGAEVITTASANHHDYVKEIGADHAIDYKKRDFVPAVNEIHPGGIDAVFDTVGGETQIQSVKALKKGGRISTILALQAAVRESKDIRVGYVFVRPDSKQLGQIKDLIEAGKLKVRLAAKFPLAEAARAQEMSKTGHTAGKIILKI